jgi:hypothetical protein
LLKSILLKSRTSILPKESDNIFSQNEQLIPREVKCSKEIQKNLPGSFAMFLWVGKGSL